MIGIFVLLQVLYFTNIIPPVPLALKEKGVYHQVYRQGDGYIGLTEKKSLLEKLILGKTIHFREGESLTMYSAVFAPNGLKTDVAHVWEHFDTRTNTWVSLGRIPFSIAGGRNDGFRWYSEKSNIFEGKWRVRVVTKRGQSLGRVEFTLKKVVGEIKLETKEL